MLENFFRKERVKAIEILLMQKFNAMDAGKAKNDREVVKEAQRRLGEYKREEVLNVLYRMRLETAYGKLAEKEIKSYES